ncbi:MAG: aldo/keto reductase [Dehalococcoidia bacterium]|nr:MAG: aldo/keto reductase [Dehalococcoidia bacterium]
MPDLPRRLLGRTGLEVTSLGYGAMELRSLDEPAAQSILDAVLGAGINFIDTSIDYGRSEELIGRCISSRRTEFFLASKCGCVSRDTGGDHVHTAENIRAGVVNSLRLLRTDYLDLVQFHRSLTEVEFKEHGALQELLRLRDEGKVRFVGVSGTLPNMSEQVDMGVFDVFQVPYSALQREHEAVITKASAVGAGIVVRGGVARGAPTDWEHRQYYMLRTETMRDRWDEARLDELLSDGMTRMEFMLRFTLSNPDLDTTIVGTKSVEHLAGNVAAALAGPLSADVVAEAKRRLAAAGSAPQPV